MTRFLLPLWIACSACADTTYFPIGKTKSEAGISEFRATWYGESLSRMKEPRLPELTKDVRAVVYRFTILVEESTLSERLKNKGHELLPAK